MACSYRRGETKTNKQKDYPKAGGGGDNDEMTRMALRAADVDMIYKLPSSVVENKNAVRTPSRRRAARMRRLSRIHRKCSTSSRKNNAPTEIFLRASAREVSSRRMRSVQAEPAGDMCVKGKQEPLLAFRPIHILDSDVLSETRKESP